MESWVTQWVSLQNGEDSWEDYVIPGLRLTALLSVNIRSLTHSVSKQDRSVNKINRKEYKLDNPQLS